MYLRCLEDHPPPACDDPDCRHNQKVCTTCGEVLTPWTGYQEVVLDKTQPNGIRLVHFCQPHWMAFHERR